MRSFSSVLLLLSFSLLLGPACSIKPPGPQPCAVSCQSALENGGLWSHIHSLRHLNACKETTVFQTVIHTSVTDDNKHLTLKSCSVSEDGGSSPAPSRRDSELLPPSISTEACSGNPDVRKSKVDLQITIRGESDEDSWASLSRSSGALSFVLSHEYNCETTALFAKSGATVMGLYVGAAVQKASIVDLLDRFTSELRSNPRGGQVSVQLCGERRQSSLVAGIFADSKGNISAAQEAVRGWNDASCVSNFDAGESMSDVEMAFLPIRAIPIPGARFRTTGGGSGGTEKKARFTEARADCEAVEVFAGDGCYSISEGCGIKQEDLEKFNPIDNLCEPGTIQEGQYLCCSEGSLPDFSPQPDSDGNCFAYEVQVKDDCFLLSQRFHTTVKDIEEVNKGTWGWVGCEGLQEDQVICLSSGKAPMPAIIANAQCGPQMPGTERPPDGTNLEELNPCPLNACCDAWGYCGTTADFCTPAPADTGAPGASKPGHHGCFSNCGTDIINNDKTPSEFINLAYYESWNLERPCSHLEVADIPDRYTHIHFAFVDLTSDFRVDTTSTRDQLDRFLKIDFAKRIVSFGGWSFSTQGSTYEIFRQGVAEGNREILASNVVDFVVSSGLDGVDFDWEYPGAPDLPDIKPDDPKNGEPYLEFLKLVREKLPADKSVAIAAPASYWYLKAFPIDEIAKVVDYVVFMTYDLHGQWDYDIWWASPGCSPKDENKGNCLRSHINMTETENALSMITKAGVPADKVLVGISSYGRSFRMEEPGCTGPLCRFAGIGEEFESAALPGECTDTEGYLGEYEIRQIIASYSDPEYYVELEEGEAESEEGMYRDYMPESTFNTWYDEDSQSDILVYAETEWVAWMDTDTKKSRIDRYRELNFRGVSDWAVDLSGAYGHAEYSQDSDESWGGTCDTSLTFKDLEDLEKNGGDLTSYCATLHTLNVLSKMLTDAVGKYAKLDENYDRRFGYYVTAVKEMAEINLNKCMSWHDDGPCTKFFTCTWHQDGVDKDTGRCPLSNHDLSQHDSFTVTFKLEDDEGFTKTLEEEFGVARDWVELKDTVAEDNCNSVAPPPGANPRPVGGNDPSLDKRQCERFRQEYKQRPVIRGDANIPNPKEIVAAAAADLDEMLAEISAAYAELLMGIWEGDDDELVEAISMSVLMVVQSTEMMEQVKEIGEEVEKTEREERTKNIISIVLLVAFIFIPIAGEAAFALGWTSLTVARLASMIGLAGDAAMTVYDAVEDPESALLTAVLMLIPGRGITRSGDMVRDIIRKKRAAGGAGLDAMGDVFKKHDTSVQNIVNICRI